MTDMDLFAVIFSGVWGLVGAIFFLVGFFIRRSVLRTEERCSERAEARVLEVIRHRHHSQSGSSSSWHPLVEFDYEGKTISLEAPRGAGRKKFYVGQLLNIRHDPDDPANFYVEGESAVKLLYLIFMVVGLAAVMIAVIALIIIKNFVV